MEFRPMQSPHPPRGSPTRVVRLIVCLLFFAGMPAGVGQAGSSGKACGPFGDPPARVIGAVKPDCGKGKLLGPWADANGTERYACLYEPVSATPDNKLPLLVYLHPSLFGAGRTLRRTNLLDFLNRFPLNGDSKRPGFILLAPQGRRTAHYYPWPDNSGLGWDNWYRQLAPSGSVRLGSATYRENVDAATIDHFVARETATGKVDTSRIYVTGWSNGAAMAYLYALNRPTVAAVAAYSGPNPFGAFSDPCPQKPVAGRAPNNRRIGLLNPHVSIMQIRNSCDLAGLCPNAAQLTAELRAAGVEVEDIVIDSSRRRVTACWSYCGTNPYGDTSFFSSPLGWSLGLFHHLRWPTGWTAAMLAFLRDHPLDTSRQPRS